MCTIVTYMLPGWQHKVYKLYCIDEQFFYRNCGDRIDFSAICNIYILRLCYDVIVCLSLRLSVTEVHWRIIANLGFKFRSKFTTHTRTRSACGCALRLAMHVGALWSRYMPGRGEGSSRTMLATARPLVANQIVFSIYVYFIFRYVQLVNPCIVHCLFRLFSPLGKLAGRAIYFTFHSFYLFFIFFSMISRRQIISRSARPIFAIFTSNESFLAVDDRSGPLFSISQGTLPWQPILCKNGAKLPTPCTYRSVIQKRYGITPCMCKVKQRH